MTATVPSPAGGSSPVNSSSGAGSPTDSSSGAGSAGARRGDGPPARRRIPLAGLRRTAGDWLNRPLTSWHLVIGIFLLLLGLGLLMVLSASSIASFNKDRRPFALFENQALFAVIGIFGFLFASKVSTRMLRTYSFPFVAVSLLLLAAVLRIGKVVNGARSWIVFGPIQFQPSEVAKLALLIWMGSVLAARRNTLRSIRTVLLPALPVFLLMVLLIMMEPDLGTTISLGIVFIAVMWFAGAPGWMFVLLSTAAAGLAYYLATSAGYRTARLQVWLHPNSVDPDQALQIHQSLYGLGHGGLFGAGLGQGITKTGWLPNADSDFIFAVIGEELGLIGAGLVVVLFGLLTYTGLRIARRNVDPFIKIVAAAATIWLVGQAAINIGYVVGLLPVTGIPLPMISRGGTSLVITMVVFGLLANFARREPQAAATLHAQGPGAMARFLGWGIGPPRPPRPPKPPKARKPRNRGVAAPAARRRQPTDRTTGVSAQSGRPALRRPDDQVLNRKRPGRNRPDPGRPERPVTVSPDSVSPDSVSPDRIGRQIEARPRNSRNPGRGDGQGRTVRP